jgi:hypothetical protein
MNFLGGFLFHFLIEIEIILKKSLELSRTVYLNLAMHF